MPQFPERPAGPDILPWLIGGLAAGALVLVGLIIALAMLLANQPRFEWVAEEPGATPEPETYSWDRPDPVCGDPCLTSEDAFALIAPDATLALVGATRTSGAAEAGVHADWESDAFGSYYLADGSPLECVFAMSPAPVSPHSQSVGWLDDQIIDLGAASGDGVTVTQFARVFQQNLDAGRYPGALRSLVTRCDDFTLEQDGAVAAVTVQALDLDPGVAGVETIAWTETWPGSTATVVDLRYGTIVVRTEIVRTAGSALSDEAIAAFIADAAQRLAAS